MQIEDELLELAREAARAAARVLRNMQEEVGQEEPTLKENNRSILTSADIAAEQAVVGVLTSGPKAIYVTEESSPNSRVGKGLCWIVDPLDGTASYFHGLNTYATSIAAWRDGKPLLGVIALPAEDSIFWAVSGRGAYGPTGPLKVSTRSDALALVSTGANVVRTALNTSWPSTEQLTAAVARAQAFRIAGSCAQELVLIAKGNIDLYLTLRQHPWDYAAGALLVYEAGGTVQTRPYADGRRDVLATNNHTAFFGGLRSEMSNQVLV